MNDAASFKNEAELNIYLEQFIGQLQLPSESIMNQLVASCFNVIEQYLPKQEAVNNNLSLKQIALLYVYNQKTIDKSNATTIALQHGHSSGAKLRSDYNLLVKEGNRVIVGERKSAYMLENIAVVKLLLEGKALAWAERDEHSIKAKM